MMHFKIRRDSRKKEKKKKTFCIAFPRQKNDKDSDSIFQQCYNKPNVIFFLVEIIYCDYGNIISLITQ